MVGFSKFPIAMDATETFHIPSNFTYRGEGNSSIVLSLPKTHQILRLRKRKKPKTMLDWFVNLLKKIFNWDDKKEIDREVKNVKFYSMVMRRLLGENFVCSAKQVFVSKRQITELDNYLSEFRPDHRKEKSLHFGQATVFDDYTYLPQSFSARFRGATYAVEIKPKQGWVPIPERKSDNCTFCTNQYLKLQRGQIEKVSSYCPFDLFSGETQRMKKAVRSLVENPQNNFRVFRNGVLLYGENQPQEVFYNILAEWFRSQTTPEINLEKFCDLVCSGLLASFEEQKKNVLWFLRFRNTIPDESASYPGGCVPVTGNNLPKGCVLKSILRLQELDQFGCEDYSKYINPLQLEDNYEYVDMLLDKIMENESMYSRRTSNNWNIFKFSSQKSHDLVRGLFFVPYLVASVARDCSIMLTFREVEDGTSSDTNAVKILQLDKSSYALSIGILDLYPKPMSTITKHCKRRKQMFKAYSKYCTE